MQPTEALEIVNSNTAAILAELRRLSLDVAKIVDHVTGSATDPEAQADDASDAVARVRHAVREERRDFLKLLRGTAIVHDENAGLIDDEHTREAEALLSMAEAMGKVWGL